MRRKTVYIDAAGSLRSGRPDEPEPDEQPDKPPNIDAGAHSNRARPQEIDMNQWVRDASRHGSRWP
jgi:hypothetical protein